MKKRKIFVLFILVFIFLLLKPSTNQAANEWEFIYYDDKGVENYLTLAENDTVAVKFTPLYNNFQLTDILLYGNTSDLTKIRVWVLNASSMDVIMDPYDPLPAIGPSPYSIDLGNSGPIFTSANVSEFFIVLQWITNDTPNFGIGIDTTSNSGRSYINESGSTWQEYPDGNIMIHAKIADINGPAFDHIPLQYAVEGNDLAISVEVTDEFGVESVVLAYHEKGSNASFDTVSFTRASGNAQKGIWYGYIPGENVTSNGLEYYIWATDVGFNQRYYGNATTPFEVEVVKMFEMPLIGNIIIILTISAVAAIVYYLLPKYKGEDLK